MNPVEPVPGGSDRPRSEQARDLLAKAAAHVLAHGFGDWSLRAIAPSLDTSHRMLNYHFGSAEAFWEGVLTEIRHQELSQRHAVFDGPAGLAASLESAWQRFSSDRYLPIMQLLFEVLGQALREPGRHQAFLDDVVHSWLQPLQARWQRHAELSDEEARLRARLELATLRGLLLDLLITGDHRATTDALRYFNRLINPPGTPPVGR